MAVVDRLGLLVSVHWNGKAHVCLKSVALL